MKATFCIVISMEDSFAEQQTFFARVNDSIFGADRERVKTIIDLYEHYECLWNVKSAIKFAK